MPYREILFVAPADDELAQLALKIIGETDTRAKTQPIAGAPPTDRPPTSIVILETQEADYPGNHLRVLRDDDLTGKRGFKRPTCAPRSIPTHHCVALRPRGEDESMEGFRDALLLSVYNHFTGARIKMRPKPIGVGAPPKVSGTTRRDLAPPAITGSI